MSSILSFLAAAFTRIFADKVIGWLAIKTVLGFLFITVVPLILNNFIYDLHCCPIVFKAALVEDLAMLSVV